MSHVAEVVGLLPNIGAVGLIRLGDDLIEMRAALVGGDAELAVEGLSVGPGIAGVNVEVNARTAVVGHDERILSAFSHGEVAVAVEEVNQHNINGGIAIVVEVEVIGFHPSAVGAVDLQNVDQFLLVFDSASAIKVSQGVETRLVGGLVWIVAALRHEGHLRVGAVRRGAHAVGLFSGIVTSTVTIDIAASGEASDGVSPLDTATPVAVVHLDHDEDVARAVPDEVATKGKHVPANHFLEVAGIDLGHSRTKGRGRGSFRAGHIGSPDGDVLDVVGIGALAVPTDVGQLASNGTGSGQFGCGVELRAERVVIEIVHRHITRGAGAITDLHGNRVSTLTTARSDVDLDVGADVLHIRRAAKRTHVVRVGVLTVAVP